MLTNKEIKKFYNKLFEKGEKKYFTSFLATSKPSSEAEEVLKEIKWKGKKVLDVGCGTGLFAFSAAKKEAMVLGVDYSKTAIDVAKKKYKAANLRFEQLNVDHVHGKYDVIVSIGTLEHMDNPFKILKLFKKHLKAQGHIIITCPNWTNPRGYILITLWYLFKAPITLADLHYLTPIDFMKWAKNLNMDLSWRTFDRSWAHGDKLIKDLTHRLPNVLADAKLPRNIKNINNFIKWLKENVVPINNSLAHSGAIGIYTLSFPKKKTRKK